MPIRFDDSLPTLTRVVLQELGAPVLEEGVVVRDISGRLAFFAARDLDSTRLDRVSQRLTSELGSYARTDRVFVLPNDYGSETIRTDTGSLVISVEGSSVRLLDRRLVGADWLRRPAPKAPPPPRFVFASLKGGVGRSTALSVAAADLASKGRRVLAIDLDMEAPGLGAMLLDEGTLPEFGLVDALVENGLSSIDEGFIADLVGPSGLAERLGRIDVVPAFGRRSLANPAEVLAKLARAYAEDVRSDGTVSTVLDQVRELVDRFASGGRYDAVLVDARAGLHETTASAILGLGADVFLFGLDEPQTFQGYGFLLAHLARFRTADPSQDWIERVTMVQGKAPFDADRRAIFADRCRDLFRRSGLARDDRPPTDVPLPAAPFGDVPWDDNDQISDDELVPLENQSSSEPLAILDDDRYKHFAPLGRNDLLQAEVYRSSFGPFLDRINAEFEQHKEEPS